MIRSKKHWYAYSLYFILILFIGIPSVLFYFFSKGHSEIHPYIRLAVLIFGLWILYKSFRRIILNSKVEWLFENNVLTIKSGLLPWKKSIFSVDSSHIYEAYFTKTFIGSILGFGGLHIRRTDGVSSAFYQYTMTNHKKLIKSINDSLVEVKKNQDLKPELAVTKESLPDELRKLADLNKDGIISDEEFEKLKKQLIN